MTQSVQECPEEKGWDMWEWFIIPTTPGIWSLVKSREGVLRNPGGMIWCVSLEKPAAEAKRQRVQAE